MEKRYYDIDKDGKYTTSYARPQPGKKLKLLPVDPTGMSMRVGKKWVNDPDKISKDYEKQLAETDDKMIMVIDDLVEYILNGTPIPQEALDKINERKNLRNKI
jgi:hypothetical protein